ncbi:uncharacterized protein [Anoplolepis gracilipes]|uniref:uncharacterized protein n=1 Tax=Anoplolepis gracilipes TaxID=354296 RepID=UPI003B9ECFE2
MQCGNFLCLRRFNYACLEVYAKGICPDGAKPENISFIISMRQALLRAFGSANLVALGVHITRNAVLKYRISHNSFENESNALNDYCMVNVPDPVISTFNNTITEDLQMPGGHSMFTSHFLTHHNANGMYSFHKTEKDAIEILGYFSPAKTLYYFADPSHFYINPKS